jgi:hypothetical protein
MGDTAAMTSDDWRLTGQEKYLSGVALKWAEWKPTRPDWEHDHCAFCWAEISDAPVGEHVKYNAGWVTATDEYHWVCPPCFDDFHDQFGWTTSQDTRP